jgi:toxin ParE1/3/4
MKIRHTLFARAELNEIADYLMERSPRGAANVRAMMAKTIALMQRHPRAGRKQDAPNVRKITVRKYPYLIYYRIGPDSIEILNVRHAARRRKLKDA